MRKGIGRDIGVGFRTLNESVELGRLFISNRSRCCAEKRNALDSLTDARSSTDRVNVRWDELK